MKPLRINRLFWERVAYLVIFFALWLGIEEVVFWVTDLLHLQSIFILVAIVIMAIIYGWFYSSVYTFVRGFHPFNRPPAGFYTAPENMNKRYRDRS